MINAQQAASEIVFVLALTFPKPLKVSQKPASGLPEMGEHTVAPQLERPEVNIV